jgi:hypothetical protein
MIFNLGLSLKEKRPGYETVQKNLMLKQFLQKE